MTTLDEFIKEGKEEFEKKFCEDDCGRRTKDWKGYWQEVDVYAEDVWSWFESRQYALVEKMVVEMKKQLSGYDDGKRTNKERQLIYRFTKLLDSLKSKLK